MRLALRVAAVLLFATPGCPPAARALPVLHVDVDGQGSTATVAVGATVSVAWLASDIPAGDDGRGLFGFGFLASFDPAAFGIGALAVDAQWTPLATFTSVGAGLVGATSSRFGQSDGPVGDDIALATAVFTALQTGVYPVSLTHFVGEGDNVLFDGTVLDGAGAGFFGTATISVVSVPEPALVALVLSSGFAVLPPLARRSVGHGRSGREGNPVYGRQGHSARRRTA